jgi:hypothetical protein
MGMPSIQNGKIRRDATPAEAQAIAQHLEDYPKCNGKNIWYESGQSLFFAKPQLRCKDDGVTFTVPTRLF